MHTYTLNASAYEYPLLGTFAGKKKQVGDNLSQPWSSISVYLSHKIYIISGGVVFSSTGSHLDYSKEQNIVRLVEI